MDQSAFELRSIYNKNKQDGRLKRLKRHIQPIQYIGHKSNKSKIIQERDRCAKVKQIYLSKQKMVKTNRSEHEQAKSKSDKKRMDKRIINKNIKA